MIISKIVYSIYIIKINMIKNNQSLILINIANQKIDNNNLIDQEIKYIIAREMK